MFPPAIDIISTSLAVAYSDGKYMNKKIEVSPRDLLSQLSFSASASRPWSLASSN